MSTSLANDDNYPEDLDDKIVIEEIKIENDVDAIAQKYKTYVPLRSAKSKLSNTLDKENSPNYNVGYACLKCKRSFNWKGQLKNHMRSHSERVEGELSIALSDLMPDNQLPIDMESECTKCNLCHKVFATNKALTNHKRTHKSKKYRCSHCDFSFARSDNFKRHMKTHTNDIFARLDASESDSSFPDDDTEMKSITKQRIGRLQPFQCDICYKECQTAQNLRYHKRSVHGPKNHVCGICEVRFSKRFNLNKHMRTKAHINTVRSKLVKKVYIQCVPLDMTRNEMEDTVTNLT